MTGFRKCCELERIVKGERQNKKRFGPHIDEFQRLDLSTVTSHRPWNLRTASATMEKVMPFDQCRLVLS
jgi:hypothetical protein